MNRVYLDNNSTTIIHPAVVEAMTECLSRGYANPASQHAEGREARKVLEEARNGIGRILGARLDSSDCDRVLLTSGGTESNNLALRGLAGLSRGSSTESPGLRRIVVSNGEHPSVAETARCLGRCGCDVQWIPVHPDGVLNTAALGDLLHDQTACVSVMLGNHETGVIQPIDEVVRICRPYAIPVHTDAVQAIGKIPVSFRDLDVDALTATAHKIHGPTGIGVLIVRHGLELEPVLTGGSQQLGTRPGTESVTLAVGMHRALEIWEASASAIQSRMRALRDQLESSLCSEIPNLVINGVAAQRLVNTTNFSIPGLDRQAMLLALDRAGIACSTGSACTSGSSEPSPVLIAMGSDPLVIDGSLRLSLSSQTTRQEIDFTVGTIVEISRHLASFSRRENVSSTTRKMP